MLVTGSVTMLVTGSVTMLVTGSVTMLVTGLATRSSGFTSHILSQDVPIIPSH